MHQITFKTEVHATRETVWQLLLDKVENPAVYIPGAVETKILERYDDGLLREVRTRKFNFMERITIDENHGEIRCFVINHPQITGWLINRIESSSIQCPAAPQLLTIVVGYIPIDDCAESITQTAMTLQFQQELHRLKEKAEKLEKQFDSSKEH
jgi:hypothetical protein